MPFAAPKQVANYFSTHSLLSYPLPSYPLLSYPRLSYPILPYPILPSPLLPYPILSSPLLPSPLLPSSISLLSSGIVVYNRKRAQKEQEDFRNIMDMFNDSEEEVTHRTHVSSPLSLLLYSCFSPLTLSFHSSLS